MLLTLRRLGPKSDRRENNSHHPLRTAHLHLFCAGEVQTNEETTVYVHDLDPFVTVQLLEDTLAVLSLGNLCEEHGYIYEWASGQKPTG